MKNKEKNKRKPIVVKVTHVEVTPEGRTERELTGEEFEQWKKDHGYDSAETQTQSDT